MVLQLVEDNHRLRNYLRRQQEEKGQVLREAQRKEGDLKSLANHFQDRMKMYQQQHTQPAEELQALHAYRTAPGLPTPRRPRTSPSRCRALAVATDLALAGVGRRPWTSPELPDSFVEASPQSARSLPAPMVTSPLTSLPPPKPALVCAGSGPEAGGKVRDILGYRAGAEPSILQREPSLSITVKFLSGAVKRGGHWADTLELRLPTDATVADVERLLDEEGVRFEPSRPHGWEKAEQHADCQLGEGFSRLLLKGAPLRRDQALKEQGIRTGSELRLIKARAYPERLRTRSGHEPRAPRGLLMNPGAPAWGPTLARRGPQDFFDGTHPEDVGRLGHLSTLAHTKCGRRPMGLDT